MAVALLLLTLLAGLLITPLGLPGTWLMVIAAIIYGAVTGWAELGLFTLLGTTVLALLAELAEHWISLHYTKLHGGSHRAGWGAVIGGIIGAVIGLPVPVLGSVFGAFAGAFLGALVAELTAGTGAGVATRAAGGAFLGRLVGTVVKCGVAAAIAVWIAGAVLA